MATLERERVSRYFLMCLLSSVSMFFVVGLYDKFLTKILLIFCIIFWLAYLIAVYSYNFVKRIVQPSILNKPYLFFILACLISVIFSVNPYQSQQIIFSRYLIYFCMFEIALTLVTASRRSLPFISVAILFSSVIYSLGAIIDYNAYRPDRLFSSWGINIPFGMFAMYLVYFVPFAYGFFLYSPALWQRLAASLIALLSLPGLIWQLSRNAWIAIFTTLVIMSFHIKKHLAVLIFVIAVGSVIVVPAFRNRIMLMCNPVSGWGDRIPEWEAGVRIFLDHPVTGAGPGMYEQLMFNYKQKYPHIEGTRNQHCHNTYLEVLSETGIIGLCAFVYIFIVFFRSAYSYLKIRSSRRGEFETTAFISLNGSILCTLIFALGGSVILIGISEPLMFWCFMGMACGILNRKDEHG